MNWELESSAKSVGRRLTSELEAVGDGGETRWGQAWHRAHFNASSQLPPTRSAGLMASCHHSEAVGFVELSSSQPNASLAVGGDGMNPLEDFPQPSFFLLPYNLNLRSQLFKS